MRKMKDSGIEWIGKIPDIWRQTKLKYVTKIRSENGMYSPEQDSYIGLENIVSRSNKLIETETIYESALYSICKKGDILFNKLRPYLAKAIISPIDGFCTGELLNIKHFDGEKRFLWYYLLSDKFIEVVNASTYGAKMPRANTDFILNLPVFLPSLSEQTKIADFLEAKCADIDQIRADIEKQIEIFMDYKKSVITEAVTKGLNPKSKMKDSGIEWIGLIPNDWSIVRIKNVSSLFGRIGFRGYTQQDLVDEDDGAITLSPSNMKNMKMNYEKCSYISWFKYNESPEIKVENGDILFVKTGSTYGKSAYVTDLPKEATINPQLIVFKQSTMNKKLLAYVLQTSLISYQTELAVVGGTIPTMSQEKIKNFIFPFPPLSEQKKIAAYLDEKCSEIDATIAEKQKQLKTLEDYKKSLIFEYVTGKKEVPA